MKSLSLKTIIQVINGRVAQGTDRLTIRNVVTGTQRIGRGTLFFDVRREKYVHHENGDKNLTYAIVTERPENFAGLGPSVALIKVARVSEAYLKFIDYYRDLFDIPVVGVTGTCGKTTTKEMIKHILSGAYKVSATYKSYNASFRNLGYLLEIDEDTQAAVYEMGVAFPGDLKKSCRYFKPKVGVITNIGVDHLQGFENLDAYIEAKAELLEGMGFAGTLILNADDQNIRTINLKAFQGKVITFGSGKRSDYRFTGVTHQENCMKFDLHHHGRLYHLTIPGHAEFNLYNAA
ncbi:MAG TPA: Mur ligase family protein, partial [Bacillota bacterium]|nr:Mur ligase family protein [Bacillota bacterium]